MARQLLTTWSTCTLILFTCVVLSSSTTGKKSKSLYSPAAEEPAQHLEQQHKTQSSWEWIQNYLLKYIDSRVGTSGSSLSASDLSASPANSVGEGRQMPTQSSLGDAIAVAGLALLFINQLSVALNLPFLLPFMLIPVALLTIAVKLLSSADNNGDSGMVTQVLRSHSGQEYAGWNFDPSYQAGWVIEQ